MDYVPPSFFCKQIKRKVQESLTDEIFLTVNGNTDSEWAFAVFLSQLKTPLQAEPFCHSVLKEAMLKTIAKLNAWGKEAGITEASMMNFAVTDGVSVVCSRYISSRTLEAASLYFSSGTRFESYKPGHYRMIKADKREDIVVIASEPLTFEKADWLTIPTNTLVVITSKLNVLMYPIVDEYHNPTPTGRAPEQANVAVVQGEGRGDGARDQRHREVVFVEDHRVIPTVPAVDSPRPDKGQSTMGHSESAARDAPARALASTAPLMVA
jgi:glutamine amidotransferase